MLFSSILKSYSLEEDFHLERLLLYALGEEIVRAIINKICIVNQLFPHIKEEPLEDVIGDSYRVVSMAESNVNPNSPFVVLKKKSI